MVVTNDDALARRMRLFIDKAWGYGDEKPDHYFPALNCRLSELQGAVALAQLGKLPQSIGQRQKMAARLDVGACRTCPASYPWAHDLALRGGQLQGELLHQWLLEVRPARARGDGWPRRASPRAQDRRRRLGAPLHPEACLQMPGHPRPADLRRQRLPFNLARPEAVNYARENYAGVYAFLSSILVLPWNERLEDFHVDHIASQIAAFAAAHVEEVSA